MTVFVNRAKMTTATTGTGTVTLGSAVSAYQAFVTAGLLNLDVVSYLITDGTAWEVGTGTYTTSGTTLSRTLIESSTASLLNLSGSATVEVILAARDIIAAPNTPGGRLTLTTGAPVMTADATAQSTVYYAPYVNALVPIYNGSSWKQFAFAQLSLALNTTDNLSTNLYDIFVFNNAGTLTLGTGPAWTSATARSAAIAMLNGVWTNNASITLRAGGSSLGAQAANTCTYLGTIYCTANGQTGMQFAPAAASNGNNSILGLYNAYNRILTFTRSIDNAADYAYNSATWRAADNSTTNACRWVDGLQQSPIRASFRVVAFNSARIGINIDATTGTPTEQAQTTAATPVVTIQATLNSSPLLGFHFAQAMEAGNTNSNFVLTGSGDFQRMELELEM